MKAPSLTELCQTALGLREQSQVFKDHAKPLDKEADEIEDQILSLMETKGRETFKGAGFIAVLKQKANSVPWAKLFARDCGAAAVEQAKTEAGNRTALELTRLQS